MELEFQPDGTYAGFPYRVLDTGEIEAFINGRVIRLESVEQFAEFVSVRNFSKPEENSASSPVPTLQHEKVNAPAIKLDSAKEHPPKKKRRLFFWLIVFPAFLYFSIGFLTGSGPVARKVVDLINSQYGGICTASLEGWGSDTLKIDWNSRTTKWNAIQVFAAVGTAKSTLYDDGVRYFKFPNDAGGFNIIDWKTGKKSSVSEPARYYFPDR